MRIEFKTWAELSRFLEYLDSIEDFSNNYKELFIKDLIEDYADDLINSKIFNNETLLAIMLFGVWQNLNRKILTFKWEDKLFLINPQRHISACETFQKKGIIPECSFDSRKDGKNIIFKEVENES